MTIRRISEREERRRQRQRQQQEEESLLCTRRQSARLLGVSVMTVRRMEAEGLLTGVRLRSENGQVLHKRSQILQLAGIAAE